MVSEAEMHDQAARVRVLDVLSEQHRRIVGLADDVAPVKRRVLDAAAELSWRSFSRAELDSRVADLADRLVSVTVHLNDALECCERAQRVVLGGMPGGDVVGSAANASPAATLPATQRPTLSQAPGFARAR
jgi:hypothetical protein